MHSLSSEKYAKWFHFSSGPVQSLAAWHSRTQLSLLRLDLLQSWTSGNKYYKLKYAIEYALTNEVRTIVSKGGMFSNHLVALAETCIAFDLHLVSVIRSFAPDENNPSIRKLRENGSEILYLTPEAYNAFDGNEAEHLFPGAFFIPEGGLSDSGIRGTSEILYEHDENKPSHIIVSGGSMATACGIISSVPADVKVIIVPAWKGCSDSYFSEILQQYSIAPVCSWQLWPGYHFGGFGRFDQRLIDSMIAFSEATGIPLDPVYTGKMMYAIDDRWTSGYFKETDSILAIHTGGHQGLDGYQYRFPEVWGKYLPIDRR
jgi:1-aminocyclopropane-1-carboxylate deaminase